MHEICGYSAHGKSKREIRRRKTRRVRYGKEERGTIEAKVPNKT